MNEQEIERFISLTPEERKMELENKIRLLEREKNGEFRKKAFLPIAKPLFL